MVPKDAEFHADSESVITFLKILYISKARAKKVKTAQVNMAVGIG